MPRSHSHLVEGDLTPYQTHLLFQSDSELTSPRINRLLTEVPMVIDHGVEDHALRARVIQTSAPRKLNKELLGWLIYQRDVPVRWAKPDAAPRNRENHLVILVALGKFLTVVTSDKSLAARLLARGSPKTSWSDLSRISQSRIENALVHGSARTLWLTGIHRSVATKPDSKILMGRDIEASLDALGDQTYEYTSTRCEGPEDGLAASVVGVTPRQGKVWIGPCNDWEILVANSQKLLQLIESSPAKQKGTPYPVLARATNSLRGVDEAFDASFAPPEYLRDEDPQLLERLEWLIDGATWSVSPTKGANCRIDMSVRNSPLYVEIELTEEAGEISHRVVPAAEDLLEEHQQLVSLLERPDILKIFYDSLHTFSDGQIFEVRTRPIAFPLKPCDFSGFDVSLEKPKRIGTPGQSDLQRVGAKGDDSLFTWVWKEHKKGWLWCDDGSGEIADFIHLDHEQSVLSFIHVKGAQSSSASRQIAVSAYEVVCSQALKNLRLTETSNLEQPFREKLRASTTIVRGWRNGKELSPRDDGLWRAIKKIPYSKLTRRVVIVQPHVRCSLLPKDLLTDTKAARRAQLLHTLLYGLKADFDRYGVEFAVYADL